MFQELPDCSKEEAECRQRIKEKTQQLKDLVLRQIAFKNLVERNRTVSILWAPNSLVVAVAPESPNHHHRTVSNLTKKSKSGRIYEKINVMLRCLMHPLPCYVLLSICTTTISLGVVKT